MAPVKTIIRLLNVSTVRWAAAYFCVFALAMAAILAAIFWQTNALLRDHAVFELRQELTSLKKIFQAEGEAGLLREIRARSKAGAAQPGVYYNLRRGPGYLAGNLKGPPGGIAPDKPYGLAEVRLPQALATPRPRRLVVFAQVPVSKNFRLLVLRDIDHLGRFVSRVFWISLAGLAFVGLVGAGMALYIARRLLRRVDAISETSRRIMSGNLSERISLRGESDELDSLSRNLNAMLSRIEQLMEGFREVSDNIAHDLKTPLTRMRTRLEGALSGPGSEDGYRRTIETTIEEADELIRTFNALLSIARLEAGASPAITAPVDLCKVVEDVGELYGPVAEEQGATLTIEAGDGPGPERLMILGDRQLIGQAISNLVENALKYGAAAPGRQGRRPALAVRLGLRQAGEKGEMVVVTVTDNGPGIPTRDRERVLKRFVRLEVSRSKPGSGLGLSLVAAVARLHGARLELSDNSPGLRASIFFPHCEIKESASIADTPKPPDRVSNAASLQSEFEATS